MAPKPKLNVQSFPRPPLLEKTPRHLQVKWRGHTIADTTDAYWVLETYHPPTYYIPKSALAFPLQKTPKSTFCEWKGWATYYSISLPTSPSSTSPSTSSTSQETKGGKVEKIEVKDRIWSYETPNKAYQAIRGYVSFYVGPWECYVDGEEVRPQPGDFYGGWTTGELEGLIKGEGATKWL